MFTIQRTYYIRTADLKVSSMRIDINPVYVTIKLISWTGKTNYPISPTTSENLVPRVRFGCLFPRSPAHSSHPSWIWCLHKGLNSLHPFSTSVSNSNPSWAIEPIMTSLKCEPLPFATESSPAQGQSSFWGSSNNERAAYYWGNSMDIIPHKRCRSTFCKTIYTFYNLT